MLKVKSSAFVAEAEKGFEPGPAALPLPAPPPAASARDTVWERPVPIFP